MLLRITPETKVGEFLAAYPELEELLVDLAPVFRKLKNPILRRTVAKVATLRTAAQMAGLEVGQLVMTLRQAAGQAVVCGDEQDSVQSSDDPSGAQKWQSDATQTASTAANWPSWADTAPSHTLDVDTLLTGGGHPLSEVRRLLRTLPPEECIRLESEFRPEPLIETLGAEGISIACRQVEGGQWETYLASVPSTKK